MKLYKEDQETIYKAHYDDPLLVYITAKILTILASIGGKTIIDLGCGAGRTALEAAKNGYVVLGVDQSEAALTIAKKQRKLYGLKKKMTFKKADIMTLSPRKVGRFDICILSEVIEHSRDYKKILQTAYSLLRSKGLLILTTPNDPAQWSVLDEYAEHKQRFSKNQLLKLLNVFDIVNIETIGFPSMRFLIFLYTKYIKRLRISHEPAKFRKNTLLSRIYFILGSILLRWDEPFNILCKGTTFIVTAKK